MTTNEATALLDCGHAPTETAGCGTGYGTYSDGLTACYRCCGDRDRSALLTEDRVVHYVASDGRTLVNWPGEKLGTVELGKRHPWSRERFYVRAVDVHGQRWHGVGAPGMWASLRKRKEVSRG